VSHWFTSFLLIIRGGGTKEVGAQVIWLIGYWVVNFRLPLIRIDLVPTDSNGLALLEELIGGVGKAPVKGYWVKV